MSIFLCVVLLITIAIPAILVEGTRIKAAQTQIESALDISPCSFSNLFINPGINI